MIKVENISVHGFDSAVRAMRHPMQSYDRSDSYWLNDVPGVKFEIGPKDLDLMRRLYKAGAEHRTYARMIYCTAEIEAPLYWWKEMDRYTVGKSQVSTSTMHKIHAKEFTVDDFSFEHLIDKEMNGIIGDPESVWIEQQEGYSMDVMRLVIDALNTYRKLYLETGDKKYWWQLIQMLPSSYNQRRTVSMSYEVVFKIIKERTGHKLDEWNVLVAALRMLPYVNEIIEE